MQSYPDRSLSTRERMGWLHDFADNFPNQNIATSALSTPLLMLYINLLEKGSKNLTDDQIKESMKNEGVEKSREQISKVKNTEVRARLEQLLEKVEKDESSSVSEPAEEPTSPPIASSTQNPTVDMDKVQEVLNLYSKGTPKNIDKNLLRSLSPEEIDAIKKKLQALYYVKNFNSFLKTVNSKNIKPVVKEQNELPLTQSEAIPPAEERISPRGGQETLQSLTENVGKNRTEAIQRAKLIFNDKLKKANTIDEVLSLFDDNQKALDALRTKFLSSRSASIRDHYLYHFSILKHIYAGATSNVDKAYKKLIDIIKDNTILEQELYSKLGISLVTQEPGMGLGQPTETEQGASAAAAAAAAAAQETQETQETPKTPAPSAPSAPPEAPPEAPPVTPVTPVTPAGVGIRSVSTDADILNVADVIQYLNNQMDNQIYLKIMEILKTKASGFGMQIVPSAGSKESNCKIKIIKLAMNIKENNILEWISNISKEDLESLLKGLGYSVTPSESKKTQEPGREYSVKRYDPKEENKQDNLTKFLRAKSPLAIEAFSMIEQQLKNRGYTIIPKKTQESQSSSRTISTGQNTSPADVAGSVNKFIYKKAAFDSATDLFGEQKDYSNMHPAAIAKEFLSLSSEKQMEIMDDLGVYIVPKNYFDEKPDDALSQAAKSSIKTNIENIESKMGFLYEAISGKTSGRRWGTPLSKIIGEGNHNELSSSVGEIFDNIRMAGRELLFFLSNLLAQTGKKEGSEKFNLMKIAQSEKLLREYANPFNWGFSGNRSKIIKTIKMLTDSVNQEIFKSTENIVSEADTIAQFIRSKELNKYIINYVRTLNETSRLLNGVFSKLNSILLGTGGERVKGIENVPGDMWGTRSRGKQPWYFQEQGGGRPYGGERSKAIFPIYK